MPLVEKFSVETDRVGRRFGFGWILSRVNLSIAPGESVALFGKNGSGKSTLLKMIATLLAPTTGSIRVLGLDTRKEKKAIRQKIRYLAHEKQLYESLTVMENLQLAASLRGRFKTPGPVGPRRVAEGGSAFVAEATSAKEAGPPPRAEVLSTVGGDEDSLPAEALAKAGTRQTVIERGFEMGSSDLYSILERMGIAKYKNQKIGELSEGTRKRLTLARLLLGEAELILLDEPHPTLDTEGREILNTMIRQWKKEGKTIVLASHDHEQALAHADRMIILEGGTVSYDGKPK